ncbi:hypothetical protein SteCoe_25543 [Stentor coeruleus]|uniref:Macrophage erythroblast attacher n=1 Tax=Stentor coeruleus TaxID=5963 RepID=A0A1R2BEY9_9CILI|nr:hypothetical protein SteCoe_25543 [Stentor coeruleus]
MSSNADFTYFRSPYEDLSSTFRTNKRKIEKELNFTLSNLKNMKNNKQNLDRTQALATISGLSSRLTSFKDKLIDLYEEEDNSLQIINHRLSSLNSSEYYKSKLLRYITEYYCRKGRFDISQSIANKSSIVPLTEISFFQKAKKICADLQSRDLSSALEWCDCHKYKLKKIKSSIEFYLKLQKFIELIRVQNFCGGILFARSHLAKYPDHQNDIQKAMMLLVIGNKPNEFIEYQDLLNEAKWDWLIKLFYNEMLRVYSFSSESTIGVILRAGFLALKNPLCESENKAEGCPLCNREIQDLAVKIPYACHSHTSIICRILHVTMDEHNPPVVLPNGQTFSEQGIKKITQDNKIVCPVTRAVFNTKQVTRVYIV